jgi:hypothetical protein
MPCARWSHAGRNRVKTNGHSGVFAIGLLSSAVIITERRKMLHNNPTTRVTDSQPTSTDNLIWAIAELEAKLPGWCWRIGSGDPRTCMAGCWPHKTGPDADLLTIENFVCGFDCDADETISRTLRRMMKKAIRARAAIRRYMLPLDRTRPITWQPSQLDDLLPAIREFEATLPGWWWLVGTGPDDHRARCAPTGSGPDGHLIKISTPFDYGFSYENPIDSPASCLRNAMEQAVRARSVARSDGSGAAKTRAGEQPAAES